MTITSPTGSHPEHHRPVLALLVEAPPTARGLPDAERRAKAHAWLIERALSRLAAWWPEGVDLPGLRAAGHHALTQVAATIADPDELPQRGLGPVEVALRGRLRSGAWYARTSAAHLRPLCAVWRGALLVGRAPTDHLLGLRLHLGAADLCERFLEVALLFAIDPAALLPTGADPAPLLTGVLAELPGDQQLAAALYFEECLTFDEIGRVMGIPAARAQELYGRAATAILAHAALADRALQPRTPFDVG